jgi:hypothetical protein
MSPPNTSSDAGTARECGRSRSALALPFAERRRRQPSKPIEPALTTA